MSNISAAQSFAFSRTSVNTLQASAGICFVYAKLYEDNCERILANTAYKLYGVNEGIRISGTTDKEGILRHEFLPDDHYYLECHGHKEVIEVYYMADLRSYDERPWILRMRDIGPQWASQEEESADEEAQDNP